MGDLTVTRISYYSMGKTHSSQLSATVALPFDLFLPFFFGKYAAITVYRRQLVHKSFYGTQ